MSTAEAAIRRAAARAGGAPLISLGGEPAAPYSVARALLDDGGFEQEVSAELARAFERAPWYRGRGGILIPPQAVLETGTATAGAELVFTRGAGVSPALRPLPVAARLGVRILSGVANKIRAVRITAGHDVEWLDGETLPADAAPQDLAFDAETGEPCSGLVTTGWSRRLDVQSSPAVEQLVEDDFRAAVAAAIDAALIAGSGASGEPNGIIARAVGGDIGTVALGADGGPITRNHLVEMEHDLAGADADFGPLAWLTSPELRAELRTTDSATDAGRFLWDGGRILDYPAFSSRHVPADLVKGSGNNLTAIILARWADALVVVHALEVVVNPYTFARQGIITATVYTVLSVALHRPESFIAIIDAEHATF
jgi:HK97 family phage major capsid protein